MKFLYIDPSVIVSVILDDSHRTKTTLKYIEEFDSIGTSELSIVECQAGFSTNLVKKPEDLVYAEQNLNQFLARMTLYSVESLMLSHARSLVKQYRASLGLRTLDAIHLATANLLRQAVIASKDSSFYFLTADKKQFAAFTAEGHLGKFLE